MIQEPWKITLFDVVNCLEGTEHQKKEPLVESVESEVVKEIWQDVCASVREVLKRYTLQDLSDKRDSQRQMNIMYYI